MTVHVPFDGLEGVRFAHAGRLEAAKDGATRWNTTQTGLSEARYRLRGMPLIEVVALPQPETLDIEQVLRTLTAAVAEALPARPEGVWATWTTATAYAVGPTVVRRQPAVTHDPVVHVYHHRPADAVDRMCKAIEEVLCRELSLPAGHVFITVQPVHIALDADASTHGPA